MKVLTFVRALVGAGVAVWSFAFAGATAFAAKDIVMFVGARPVEYAETYITFNGERYPGGVLEKCQASFRLKGNEQ